MNFHRIIYLAMAATAALLLSGCAGVAITGTTDLDKKYFDNHKKFAVVSVSSSKVFHGEQGLSQRFTSDDNIPGVNTQPIIDKLSPKLISRLSSSRHFTLVPESQVLSSPAYKRMAEDEHTIKIMMFSMKVNAAKGYKYFTDEKKFAKLAHDLNVDGVIALSTDFGVNNGGGKFSIMGLSAGKTTYSSVASVTATAYNRKGEIIWQDKTVKEAEPGDTKSIVVLDVTSMTDTHFLKLHPSAIEMGNKAMGILMARLDDTLAGREVSRFQSFK